MCVCVFVHPWGSLCILCSSATPSTSPPPPLSLQVRVKAISLEGARLRAVGRVPENLKVVGRMPTQTLAKFLVDLTKSKSRYKAVVRFDLESNSMKKLDPAAVKSYNRLVEVVLAE